SRARGDDRGDRAARCTLQADRARPLGVVSYLRHRSPGAVMTAFRIGRLEVDIQASRAVLVGRLDETVQLDEIARRLPAGDVAIDTAGIGYVNSIGMREWIRLTRTLRDRGVITLEAVSEVLITQMNMLSEFRTSVRVKSFYATYACPRCGREAPQ